MLNLIQSTLIIGIIPYLIFVGLELKRKKSLKTILINILFFFYMISLINVTLMPLPIGIYFDETRALYDDLSNNFIPFHTMINFFQDERSYIIKTQIGGNIALFLPFGFLVPLLKKKKGNVWNILGIGFLCSLGIETLQFLISTLTGYTYKVFDVDDLILNTLGSVIGYGLFKIFVFFKAGRQKRENTKVSPQD